jgi:hypothetical protein
MTHYNASVRERERGGVGRGRNQHINCVTKRKELMMMYAKNYFSAFAKTIATFWKTINFYVGFRASAKPTKGSENVTLCHTQITERHAWIRTRIQIHTTAYQYSFVLLYTQIKMIGQTKAFRKLGIMSDQFHCYERFRFIKPWLSRSKARQFPGYKKLVADNTTRYLYLEI